MHKRNTNYINLQYNRHIMWIRLSK